MTLYLNDGDCVVQIIACEQDAQRLCDDISRHVAADRAKHAAVYTIDQTRSMPPKAASQSPQDTPTRATPSKLPSFYLGHGNLTLTLLNIDTTFRFNSVRASACSPGLAWPTIITSFASVPFVDDDLILRAQYYYPNARSRADNAPGSLLLHIEISASAQNDALLLEIAKLFRGIRCSWTRQLLFSQDPARFRKDADSVLGVLMQEFDSQHTAETIAADLDNVSLRRVSNEYRAEISVRLFSLVGSSSQRRKVPMDPSDLPIQNSLYAKPPGSDVEKKASYFGLREESYVHI